MAHLRLVSTLRLPAGGFPRGTRGVAGFAEDALGEVDRGADELALLEPPGGDRRTFLAALERTAAAVRIPVIALAAVAEVDQVRALLEAGADRVAPGPAIVVRPSLLEACAARTGRSRLVAEVPVRRRAVDAAAPPRLPSWARGREEELLAGPGGFEVLGAGGAGTGLSFLAWAAEAVRRGAGELLVSCEPGPDPSPIRALTRVVRAPLAVRVGAADAADVRPVLEAGADAIHLPGGETPRLVRRALAALGVPA